MISRTGLMKELKAGKILPVYLLLGEDRGAKDEFLQLLKKKIYKTEDLIDRDDVFFAATGVSSGNLLRGVRYFSGGAQTQSIAMRGRSVTMRWVDARHNFNKLEKLDSMKYVKDRRWAQS